ncbi:MAG: hypothetical protein HYS22_04905 [Deltaproteobacteria bacterium]|nr:hypothetical protein [Deltaproteobacteria bacterium]
MRTSLKRVLLGFGLAIFILVAGVFENEAHAIPAWARRYSADCSMCHTMIPRLNPMGHKFRRLGYRMPDEFDKQESDLSWDEMAKMTNYFSARGRARVNFQKTAGAKADFDFEMHDVTLFYSGPVSRNVAFFFELPFEPEEGHAFLEVGSIHLNFGGSDSFFFSRVGQFHQFSRVGYGGLDRPIGLNNPRVFDVRVNGFRPRHDGVGAEAGYSYHNFTGLVQVTNGLEAAGGSVLDNEDPNNHKDLAALLEYMIPESDGSVSLLYVYGRAPNPVNDKGVDVAGAANTKYHRAYLFGDYTFDSIGLKPLVGVGMGLDNQFVSGIGSATAALVSADNSFSWFSFLELDQRIKDNLYAVVRFDYDDVTNKAEAGGTSKTWMGTGGIAWSFQKFLRVSAEYQATDSSVQNMAHQLRAETQLNF